MNLNPESIILLCQHGSHLYGTNTSQSDLDLKGIYQASLKEIVLGEAKDTLIFNTKSAQETRKNSPEDEDCQYKELRKFIQDALDGQIYALDLIFSPRGMWMKSSDIWEDIVLNRSKLLSSNIKPFVGYARQQAAKYGLKGGRLAEVIRFRDWLLKFEPAVKIGEIFSQYEQSEYVRENIVFLKKQESYVTYIQVLEKQFQLNHRVGNLAQNLSQWIDKYGERSRRAMTDKGIDYKALSHAVRCFYQAKELLTTGEIIFPLAYATFLRDIKQGNIPYSEIQAVLSEGLDELKVINSVLPSEPDHMFWKKKIIEYYEID